MGSINGIARDYPTTFTVRKKKYTQITQYQCIYVLHTEIVYFRKVYNDFCTNSKYYTKAAPDLGEEQFTLLFRSEKFKSYKIE